MLKLILVSVLLLVSIHSQADTDLEYDTLPESPELPVPQPTPEPAAASPFVMPKLDFNKENAYKYRYELAAVTAILLYLIMYRRGRSANSQLIERYYKQVALYIHQNFAHIGFTKTSRQDPFVAESASDAMYYATGRQNINYMEIKFTMRKRQDLLYSLIYETIWPEKDLITIDIPVKAEHPIVLCIANRKKIAKTKTAHRDIERLAGSFDVANLPTNFAVLGESQEVVDYIVDNSVCKRLQNLGSLVQSIHYSDQLLPSNQTGHLRAIFYASAKNEDKYLKGLELIFYLVDRIHGMKVSANYKTKAQKARESFNAEKQKENLEKVQEEMRKKKQEKKRQEEAWLRSLPPEKQKREDEKRKKKEVSKMYKSKTMKSA